MARGPASVPAPLMLVRGPCAHQRLKPVFEVPQAMVAPRARDPRHLCRPSSVQQASGPGDMYAPVGRWPRSHCSTQGPPTSAWGSRAAGEGVGAPMACA
eukprot:CAMPEP_0206010060 /NCGR_PEP_ID=MMETSP1464-20131121/10844_1 /ASSEMBLY_ACC=CAM_ASM_001124 /TAXON_ID=119497 /ORGANISM="Exanthemachrysis gayraliae, Strain RCC1523" /LENGTH=98 /DNA_ID=CAMNT_0053383669 /DNA_START=35 /DNA_END=328 /DNA_ORIENTATION=-